MSPSPPRIVALVAIVALLHGAGCAAPPPPYAGTPVLPPNVAADAVLVDEAGKPKHVIDRTFAATFLFFGYTHCPDACPLALGSLAHAYRSLPTATRARVRIVFVTVDPTRDVPGVMRRYVGRFDAPIVGLTGSRAALARTWAAYDVRVDARTHEIGHGDTILAIDRDGRTAIVYPADASASDLAHDAALLAR